MHIAAHTPPISRLGLNSTFFYNQTSCWGWATWRDRWLHFDRDASNLHSKLVSVNFNHSHFNIEDSQSFLQQLTSNINGTLNSWAIKWHASVYLRKGLCLHPSRSLVRNIGFDNMGTHCSTDIYEFSKQKIAQSPVNVCRIKFEESKLARTRISRFYRRENVLTKVKQKLKSIYVLAYQWI